MYACICTCVLSFFYSFQAQMLLISATKCMRCSYGVSVCVCVFGGVFEIVTIMWLFKVNIVYSEKAIVYIWFQTYFKSPNDPHLTWAMPILATILSHQIAKYLAKIARTVDNNNNSNSYIGPHRWCTLASVAYILRLVAVENISWFNRYIVGYR